ncbi:hypothetical protein [Emticicia sp. BO119]|uniref:hypothetical protein n=1 Tax=Emticicia sp. BO119 TaxID=2757768 RepID=UPI0015F10D70|nr:hypothetical protein [Emticicia sp. BO119]MBA4852561.1 hypothetical protein [Emticicia sp. BO119]
MPTNTSKIRFDNSGYYFFVLVILVILGFWPSYFSGFFNGNNSYSFYFHFHAFMMSVWIMMLIIQPLLIRKKKLGIHRMIGKLSYAVMPLLFISVLLLVHSRIKGSERDDMGLSLFVPFKDLLILAITYSIAIKNKRDYQIHARAMVATGIVFIEPALARFMGHSVFKNNGALAYFATIGIIYAILIALMIIERKQKKARWIFPLVLVMYIIVHSILIFSINIPFLNEFAKWFASLPLT